MDAAELVVRITGDIDDIEAKLNRTASAATSMGDRIEKAGRSMTSAGQSMTRGLTLPLAAIGGLAIKSALDFESAFAGVKKTIDGTDEEFAQLEAGIRQMSKSLPASAVEIAGVAEAAGQLGIAKENILSFSKTMIDLGETTNLTADQAAEALARIANITQMPQDQFDRLGATIVALGNAGASTESDITQMALRIAGAGHQVGLSQAEIVSFASALSSVGIEAEAGGSAISRAFIKISMAVNEGGDAVEGFAEVAGMSASQFSKAFKDDAAGAMVTFMEGLGRVKDEGGNVFKVLGDLGMEEIRLRDALLRAAGAGDLFREQLVLGSKAWEENLALTEEADKRYATSAAQLEMFKNKVTDAAVTLGGAMVPALLKLLESLEPVGRWLLKGIEWFANLSPGVQAFIVGLVALIAVAGPILMFVGALVTAVGTIAGALGIASLAFLGWAAVIALVVAAVVGAALFLWKNWDSIWGWITDKFGDARDFLVRNFDTILAIFLPVVAALLWLWRNWDEIWEKVKTAVLVAALWIGEKVDSLITTLSAFPGRAWSAVASFVDRMWDVAYEAMANMASAVNDGLSNLVGWFGELPGRLVEALGDLAGILYDIGASVIQGFWDGMLAVWRRVTGWVSGVAGWIRDNKGPIEKDRVLLEPAGEEIIGGLIRGMQAEQARLMALLHGMTADVGASFSIAPAPTPTAGAGQASAGTSSDHRIVALLEELVGALKDHKGVEMTFNTPVDPMHVAREVAWSMGGE